MARITIRKMELAQHLQHECTSLSLFWSSWIYIMALLKFLEDLETETSPLQDLWRFDEHDVPEKPGVYILVSDGTVHFPYPGGNSPIFYIGQSVSLFGRLKIHRNYSNQAKHDRQEPLYWPRYEYAARFGARYCYITRQCIKPKALEDLVLARFAKKYFSFPVANGAGAWKRVSKEMGW